MASLMCRSSLLALAISAGISCTPLESWGPHTPRPAPASLGTACRLRSPAADIRHVIHLEFDNVHFSRDNPDVPSDVEQMPHLLSFIKDHGTLLAGLHTPLLSHTANAVLTTLTGLYPSSQGQAVANSYRYFNPDGTTSEASSFSYWTAPTGTAPGPGGTTYNLTGRGGVNVPAPWVPFTRAGCDFGSVGTANTVLENPEDIAAVFGAGSPEARAARSDPSRAKTDYLGVAIHCARASATCSRAKGGQPDLLPDEPGGYRGFSALFGHIRVAPVIQPQGTALGDLFGGRVGDAQGHAGFPGFGDLVAPVALSYVAAMQEGGIPITYGYVSTMHDPRSAVARAWGPGEKEYVRQLQTNDAAFARFFDRLQLAGITPANSVFVFANDEGDHFVGGPPSPAGCDGITTACSYQVIGQVGVSLGEQLVAGGFSAPVDIHSDSAAAIWVRGNPPAGSATTRTLGRTLGRLEVVNPISGRQERLITYLADGAELRLLHMVTGDLRRTPTVVAFAQPDYWLTGDPLRCSTRVCIDSRAAWSHGGLAPDINASWAGLVGPGVSHGGIEHNVWAEETDLRPTMLSLAGLKDDYLSDGRTLVEVLEPQVLPTPSRSQRAALVRLGQARTRINAPVGELALSSLRAATAAIKSDTADDSRYRDTASRLRNFADRRDSLSGEMESVLTAATVQGEAVESAKAGSLVAGAEALIRDVDALPAASA